MSYFRLLAISLFILWPAVGGAAPVYVYKQPDGSIKFTTKKPPAGTKSQVFTAKRGSYSHYSVKKGSRWKLYPNKYQYYIEREAKRNNLDPALVQAVIHAESGFNPRARSHKGAMGLMQLMPQTANLMNVGNPYEPAQNIRGGVQYLGSLYQKYGGNIKYALAAYNAGPGAVEQYSGIPPFRETKEYVKKVLKLLQRYRTNG